MYVQGWVDVIVVSLQNLWALVIGFLPNMLGALLVLLIGLIVAAGLERLVERLVFYLRIDALLEKMGVGAYLQRANLQLNVGHFLGKIVYWFMVVAFLLAASDILSFTALSGFLQDVLLYIPNVLIAALILLVAVVAANFLKGLVLASVLGAKLHAAKFLGTATWWVVMIFGLLTSAAQLNIAVAIINTLITGMIAMLALAGGLAFGLGGRDSASRWIAKMENEVRH
ncbi:MAG: hypothetical protein Q7R85_00305 [bacterium]|nr:hypothetical protein [bacterium]